MFMPEEANIGGGGGKKATGFGAALAIAGFVSLDDFGDRTSVKVLVDVDLDDRLLTGIILISLSRLFVGISSFLLVVFVGVISASGSMSSLSSSII